MTPHPIPTPKKITTTIFSSTKLDQIQYATLYQPKLVDSCTEQQSVLFNPNQIQYKTKTIQLVMAQLRIT